MTRVSPSTDKQELRQFAVEAARLCVGRHCEDVRLIDVRGISQVCDYLLIATGTSDRQMQSVSAELAELGGQHDHPAFRTSRDDSGTWIVIDFVDLVAHLFEPNQRDFYALEELWSDGHPVAWDADEE